MLQKLKFFLAQGNCAQWCVFLFLTLAILVKGVLFHWACFHSFSPMELSVSSFILNKLLIAIFVSSFVFVPRGRVWSMLGLFVVDMWSIANLLYYRANSLFLSVDAIKMAGNLAGFESSIVALINTELVVYVLVSLVLFAILLLLFRLTEGKRSLKSFAWMMLVAYVLMLLSHFPKWIVDYESSKETLLIREVSRGKKFYHKTKRLVIPFYNVAHFAKISEQNWESCYINDYSGVHYLAAVGIHYAAQKHYKPVIALEPVEEIVVHALMNNSSNRTTHNPSNLVVIFVESLESWTLEMTDAEGNCLLPHLAKWTSRADLYCDKVRSQVKNGVSGDGQLIFNTGLLPINQGAACLLYGHNTYPNFAHGYERAAIINPGPNIWGQDVVTFSYGYKELIGSTYSEQDAWVLQTLINYIEDAPNSNFCVFAKTITSHMPFNIPTGSTSLFPNDMPEMMQKYLQCLHYTDSCIGRFIDYAQERLLLENTTIVITGDHTVFKKHMLHDFQSYAIQNNLPIQNEDNYVPLIVYSPQIKERTIITEECYQMDIYPTIMHLIGYEDYYWKGFGINLLDSTACHNRPITEQEAYELSDKIIRSNYFATIKQ